MRLAPALVIPALTLALALVIPTGAQAQDSTFDVIEVLVTAGGSPLAEASVALDLNNNGVWEEHLGEPRLWTDGAGIAYFSNVVSIQDPGGGGPIETADWQPTRIMMGNVRGSVGAADVLVDYVLPPGTNQARLGLYDLRGRCLAETGGAADLVLDLPGGLPSGVYFLRLSAAAGAAVSQRITSVGMRTRSVTASRVSDAVAAAGFKGGVLDDPYPINLMVELDGYLPVVQPEVVNQGHNHYTVVMIADPSGGFVYIPPGDFDMGSPASEPGRYGNEHRHRVTLTRGFYMARHEVTEAWWYQVMGGDPSDSRFPKRAVSWDMAVQFCNALSLQEGLVPAYTIHGPNGNVTWDQDASGYRLPTEAEWEYACRAGSTSAFASGPITNIHCSPIDPNLDELGWYCGNCPPTARRPVAKKGANAWGLHDMHGNVWEWVWDGYLEGYHLLPPQDPVHHGSPNGYRTVRGGSLINAARNCRSAYRHFNFANHVNTMYGLRPVRSDF